MYDIIFDFSSSAGGGGKKRAEAYAKVLEARGLHTLFLVNSKLTRFRDDLKNVKVEYVQKGSLERLLNDGRRLLRYSGKARWYFAYGIPIYRRIGEKNWYHLSNVLPFARGRYSASLALKAKMELLGRRVRRGSANIDQFSAESLFGKACLGDFIGREARGVLLQNGIDEIVDRPFERSDAGVGRYAATIGTYSYKRLDRVLDVFLHVRETMGLETLRIVGETSGIAKSVSANPHVELLGSMELSQVIRLLANASLFISASEIENSSNAVLEALSLDTKTVLSCIPSHLEMIDRHGLDSLVLNGNEYVIAEKRNIMPEYMKTWSDIVDTMLTAMGF